MKIKFGKYLGGLLGTKVIGFVYDETYDCNLIGLVIWNYGIFLAWGGD